MHSHVVTALLVLSLLSIAQANADDTEDVSDCHGSVKGESAVFIIPNPRGETSWVWNKPGSRSGQTEYEWSVTLGTSASDERFSPTGFGFGFAMWKWEEAEERTGSLSELIGEGEYYAWEMSISEGREIRTPIVESLVKIGPWEDSVMLGTHDPKTFNRLFETKPETALLRARHPAIDIDFSCIISIEYIDES